MLFLYDNNQADSIEAFKPTARRVTEYDNTKSDIYR